MFSCLFLCVRNLQEGARRDVPRRFRVWMWEGTGACSDACATLLKGFVLCRAHSLVSPGRSEMSPSRPSTGGRHRVVTALASGQCFGFFLASIAGLEGRAGWSVRCRHVFRIRHSPSHHTQARGRREYRCRCCEGPLRRFAAALHIVRPGRRSNDAKQGLLRARILLGLLSSRSRKITSWRG